MISVALALILTGCAGYAFTLPSDCAARYALDFLTTQLPANGAVCAVVGPELWSCRYWSAPTSISCLCFEERDPPPWQVWMRVTP